MRFRLTRTSYNIRDAIPYKEAEPGEIEYHEYGDVTKPLRKAPAWFITLNSLEELMAFANKYGELVIEPTEPAIEIYDDYRE